jgi:hypothetical protein
VLQILWTHAQFDYTIPSFTLFTAAALKLGMKQGLQGQIRPPDKVAFRIIELLVESCRVGPEFAPHNEKNPPPIPPPPTHPKLNRKKIKALWIHAEPSIGCMKFLFSKTGHHHFWPGMKFITRISYPLYKLGGGTCWQSHEILLNKGMKFWDSGLNTRGLRTFIATIHRPTAVIGCIICYLFSPFFHV